MNMRKQIFITLAVLMQVTALSAVWPWDKESTTSAPSEPSRLSRFTSGVRERFGRKETPSAIGGTMSTRVGLELAPKARTSLPAQPMGQQLSASDLAVKRNWLNSLMRQYEDQRKKIQAAENMLQSYKNELNRLPITAERFQRESLNERIRNQDRLIKNYNSQLKGRGGLEEQIARVDQEIKTGYRIK